MDAQQNAKIIQIIGVENNSQTQTSVMALDELGNVYELNHSEQKWQLAVSHNASRIYPVTN